MSSPCRSTSTRAIATVLVGVASVAANTAFAQAPAPAPPGGRSAPPFVAVTKLFPGGGSPPAPDPADKLYLGNPRAIAEGARLFDWYNCSGCHFHGAGGIGPALMDQQWLYGGELDQIFASISQGRPNGMPSWHGKIPDTQIWEIAAYVKSLSAPNPANGGQQPVTTPPPQPAAQPPPPAGQAAPK